jgi:hypothetical protein
MEYALNQQITTSAGVQATETLVWNSEPRSSDLFERVDDKFDCGSFESNRPRIAISDQGRQKYDNAPTDDLTVVATSKNANGFPSVATGTVPKKASTQFIAKRSCKVSFPTAAGAHLISCDVGA